MVNPCWPLDNRVVWDIEHKRALQYINGNDLILTDFSSGTPVPKLQSILDGTFHYLFRGNSEVVLLGDLSRSFTGFMMPENSSSDAFDSGIILQKTTGDKAIVGEQQFVYEIPSNKLIPHQANGILVKLSPDESKLIYPLEVKNKKTVEVHMYSFADNKDTLITTVRFESPLGLNYCFSKSGQKVYVVNNNEYKVNKDKTFKKFIRVYDTTTGKLMNTLEMTFDKNLVIGDLWSDE